MHPSAADNNCSPLFHSSFFRFPSVHKSLSKKVESESSIIHSTVYSMYAYFLIQSVLDDDRHVFATITRMRLRDECERGKSTSAVDRPVRLIAKVLRVISLVRSTTLFLLQCNNARAISLTLFCFRFLFSLYTYRSCPFPVAQFVEQ